MLSVNPGPIQAVTDSRQRTSAINNAILRISSQLGDCKSEDIDDAVHSALNEVSTIESAAQAGWFLLSDSGKLLETFPSASAPFSQSSAFKDGLQAVPWCLAQLRHGKAVVIDRLDDMLPEAEGDRQFLHATGVHSFALLPSSCGAFGNAILILSSVSAEIEWSHKIVEQYTLLGNLFSNAYQRSLAHNKSQTSVKCFQQLFIASTIAMALINKTGQLVSTNYAFRRMLGYSENEARKLKYSDITCSKMKAASLHHDSPNQAAANPRSRQTLIRKDHSLMAARIKVYPMELTSREDDLLSLVQIEDLTVQNSMKEELHKRQTEVGALASQLIQSQDNERKRLSRELHDDIGQRLSLAASEAASLASQHADDTPVSTDRLNTLRDELDSLCSDVHGMSHNLHSYKLQHLGLQSALKDLCRKLSRPDFRVDLHLDEFDEPASKDISLCLYRVAQESLNNAFKHARTPVAAVTLTKLQNTFYMTIQDSGIGFDSTVSSQGLGLLSMSERLKLVEGHLRLHSIPGRGTEIWVEVPDEQNIISLHSGRKLPIHSTNWIYSSHAS